MKLILALQTAFVFVISTPFKDDVLPFGPGLDSSFTVNPANPSDSSYSQSSISVEDAKSIALMSFDDLHDQGSRSDLKVTSASQASTGLFSVYVLQYHLGFEVINGVGSVHIDKYGSVVAKTESFAKSKADLDALFKPDQGWFQPGRWAKQWTLVPQAPCHQSQGYTPKISRSDALKIFAEYLGLERVDISKFDGKHLVLNEYPKVATALKLLQLSTSSIRLVHVLNLDLGSHWYDVAIDASTGSVLQLIDWISQASYNVFPLGFNDPTDGPRSLQVNPEHPVASPLGWTTSKANKVIKLHYDTQGNNVFAQDNPRGGEGWRRNHRAAGKGLVFDAVLDLKKGPSKYTDAAIINLFYWNNIIHDLLYVYGFTESAGNFQENIFERGGRGGDAVAANAQDGSGQNNANFATPPDGVRPRMRMYVWTQTEPDRDGDLEAGIIVHEYSHGLSTRLTGGPANSGCLGYGESGGMGEGWGDFIATMLRMSVNTTRDDDFSMGGYSNGGQGIRIYNYSTNNVTNPSTYGYIRKPQYWGVHAKGEVWAEILYEVAWALMGVHGWEDDWFSIPLDSERPLAGNKLIMQLVVDGMKIQPCSPTFVSSRDAILVADRVLSGGENKCLMWSAFAKRGLGIRAKAGGGEDFTVPSECM